MIKKIGSLYKIVIIKNNKEFEKIKKKSYVAKNRKNS